ncbi:MAG: hypothetical protein EZS28_039389, partial [Streblomastix strix]
MIKCVVSSTEELNPIPTNQEDSQIMEQTPPSFPDMEMFAKRNVVGEKNMHILYTTTSPLFIDYVNCIDYEVIPCSISQA